MVDDAACTRRDFARRSAVTGLAAASAGTPLAAAAPAPGLPPAGGRPRISCVSWCFHALGAGNTRPEEAIELIGQMGFEGIELILTGRAEIGNYWTDGVISRIRKRLEHYKLEVPQFALFQPVVEELADASATRGRRHWTVLKRAAASPPGWARRSSISSLPGPAN